MLEVNMFKKFRFKFWKGKHPSDSVVLPHTVEVAQECAYTKLQRAILVRIRKLAENKRSAVPTPESRAELVSSYGDDE
jgi:hypothetical protein